MDLIVAGGHDAESLPARGPQRGDGAADEAGDTLGIPCGVWPAAALLGGLLLAPPACGAADARRAPPRPAGVDVIEHLDARCRSTSLHGENGQHGSARRLLRRRPPGDPHAQLLQLPDALRPALNGLLDALSARLDAGPGVRDRHGEHQPARGPAAGRAEEADYLEEYGRPAAAEGWHFLTGEEHAIRRARRRGRLRFRYERGDRSSTRTRRRGRLHPRRAISRYLYGIDFDPRDPAAVRWWRPRTGKIGNDRGPRPAALLPLRRQRGPYGPAAASS